MEYKKIKELIEKSSKVGYHLAVPNIGDCLETNSFRYLLRKRNLEADTLPRVGDLIELEEPYEKLVVNEISRKISEPSKDNELERIMETIPTIFADYPDDFKDYKKSLGAKGKDLTYADYHSVKWREELEGWSRKNKNNHGFVRGNKNGE